MIPSEHVTNSMDLDPDKSSPKSIINSLRIVFASEVSENRLVDAIDVSMKMLQATNLQNNDLFSESDANFLQKAGDVKYVLKLFIDTLEDIEDVYDESDYLVVSKKLNAINAALQGMPVAGRVAKEIRQLQERLPDLRKREVIENSANLERVKKRIITESPKCSKGHVMVLREFPQYFWGCSNFPWCKETKQLSQNHKKMLDEG